MPPPPAADATQPSPTIPLSDQITRALVFPQRLVWVGKAPPSDADNQDLWRAIGQFKTADVAAAPGRPRRLHFRPPGFALDPLPPREFRSALPRAGPLLARPRTLALRLGLDSDLPGRPRQNRRRLHPRPLCPPAGPARPHRSSRVPGRPGRGTPAGRGGRSTSCSRAPANARPPSAPIRGTLSPAGAAALEEVGRVLQPKFPEVKNPVPPVSPAGYSLTELKSLAKAYNLDMVPVRWPRGEVLPVSLRHSLAGGPFRRGALPPRGVVSDRRRHLRSAPVDRGPKPSRPRPPGMCWSPPPTPRPRSPSCPRRSPTRSSARTSPTATSPTAMTNSWEKAAALRT